MPTLVSQQPLDEVARLINEACEAGDNVSAIAERTGGVTRELVSRLRNGTYDSSPSLDKLVSILDAIGYRVRFEAKNR